MQICTGFSEREIVQKYNVLPYYQQYEDVSILRFSTRRPTHDYHCRTAPPSQRVGVSSWAVEPERVGSRPKRTEIHHDEIEPSKTKSKGSLMAQPTRSRSQSSGSGAQPSGSGMWPKVFQSVSIKPTVIQQIPSSLPFPVEVPENQGAFKQSRLQRPRARAVSRKPEGHAVEGNIIIYDDSEQLTNRFT